MQLSTATLVGRLAQPIALPVLTGGAVVEAIVDPVITEPVIAGPGIADPGAGSYIIFAGAPAAGGAAIVPPSALGVVTPIMICWAEAADAASISAPARRTVSFEVIEASRKRAAHHIYAFRSVRVPRRQVRPRRLAKPPRRSYL